MVIGDGVCVRCDIVYDIFFEKDSRGGLVGYDAALTQLRSRVQFPAFVLLPLVHYGRNCYPLFSFRAFSGLHIPHVSPEVPPFKCQDRLLL